MRSRVDLDQLRPSRHLHGGGRDLLAQGHGIVALYLFPSCWAESKRGHGAGDVPGVVATVSVAVHRVKVELGRIDREVVRQVVRLGQHVQEAPPLVKFHLGLAAIADPRPRLCLLRGKLHRHALSNERLDSAMQRPSNVS